MIEIQRGTPVARIAGGWLAFSTKSVLSTGLLALGDASTVGNANVLTQKGLPWQAFTHPISAPAAYCKEIDVAHINVNG
jgi:hypothetical protein